MKVFIMLAELQIKTSSDVR